MMQQPSFPHDTFLAKWLSGELTDAEWNEWKDVAGEAELKRIVETVEQWQVPASRSQAEAWQQLTTVIEENTNNNARIRSLKVFRWASVAATVLLIAGIAYLFRDTRQYFSTDVGEKLTVVLPDESEVILNAGSSLHYDESSWSENRMVELQGEAYFQVEKGQQFTVHTEQGDVRVLGTRFNVQDRPEKWEVRCFSGKVQVSPSNGGEGVVLTAGQSVRQLNTQMEKAQFEPDEQQLWVHDFVYFDGAPLRAVVAELERQYQLTVVWPAELDPEKTYTGGFPHQNLDNALEMVFGPSNYLTKLEEGKVLLTPRR